MREVVDEGRRQIAIRDRPITEDDTVTFILLGGGQLPTPQLATRRDRRAVPADQVRDDITRRAPIDRLEEKLIELPLDRLGESCNRLRQRGALFVYRLRICHPTTPHPEVMRQSNRLAVKTAP